MYPDRTKNPENRKTNGYQGENIADEDIQASDNAKRDFPDAGGLWTNGHGDVMVYPPTLV